MNSSGLTQTNGNQGDGDYAGALIGFARGERSADGLPLGDEAFWSTVLAKASRPGLRSMRRPMVGAAAEHLLRRRLLSSQEQARCAAAMRCLTGGTKRMRRLAVRALQDSPATLSTAGLRQAAESGDPEVRLAALAMLAGLQSEEALAYMAGVLREASDFRAVVATHALTHAGGAAVPHLLPLMDSPNANQRRRAVECLARIQTPATLAPLLRALHDPWPDIAWLAADGLLALGPSTGAPVLRSVLHKKLQASTARALRHYAEHSEPQSAFREIVAATEGLGKFAAIPVAVEAALERLPTETPGP